MPGGLSGGSSGIRYALAAFGAVALVGLTLLGISLVASRRPGVPAAGRSSVPTKVLSARK